MTSLDLGDELIVDLVHCTSVKQLETGFLFEFPKNAHLKVFTNDFNYDSPTRDVSGTLSVIDASRCKLFASIYLKEASKK
jgi:hypothetical protein